MSHERILIVDDEAHIVRLCTKVLTAHGYVAQGTTSGREAIAHLEAELQPQGEGFHLLVVDIKMPDVDGLTVLRRGRELDPLLAAVVITGYGTLDSAIEALHAGAQRFVLKPFERRGLLLAVEEALAQRRKEQERLRLRAQMPIMEISQALLADGNVESMAGPLLEIVMRQIGADRAALLLLDEGADELYVVKGAYVAIGGMPTACHEFHEFTRKPARTIGEIRVIRGKKPVALSPPQLVHAPW